MVGDLYSSNGGFLQSMILEDNGNSQCKTFPMLLHTKVCCFYFLLETSPFCSVFCYDSRPQYLNNVLIQTIYEYKNC